jgi:hypothetical protein
MGMVGAGIKKSGIAPENTALNQSPFHLTPTRDATMTEDEERAFQEYLDSQDSPALREMERAGDLGPALYSPEVFDEMVRHDMEGLT